MDFKDSQPIYLQITDGIMDQILDGTYPPDGRIPSVREYAAKVEVNANTVMRSYDWLQQQQIIFNRRGIGYFVLHEAPKRIIEMRRNIFFRDEMEYYFNRLASFGITPENLANQYADYLNQKQKR